MYNNTGFTFVHIFSLYQRTSYFHVASSIIFSVLFRLEGIYLTEKIYENPSGAIYLEKSLHLPPLLKGTFVRYRIMSAFYSVISLT